MEQPLYNIQRFFRKIKTFLEQQPQPCRSKFKPRKSPLRNHAPVSSLYLLDYDRRVAELGLEHEPPTLHISGQRLSFRRGRWALPLTQGPFRPSQCELVRGVREKNRVLQDQNNLLQLKLEVAMDMLTETMANLMLVEGVEMKTEDEQGNGEKEEEEEVVVEKEEKKASLKKSPKQLHLNGMDWDSYELENDELLISTEDRRNHSMPLTSEDEEELPVEDVSLKFITQKRQGDAKPKVCPMRRAEQAKAKLQASLYSLPPVGSRFLVSPKFRSSLKVCKLELEPEPKPRPSRQRRLKPRAKPVEGTNGTCPMKRRSRL
ncbi:uncharacterized protein [Narcine bancroftii]|uniref:uncharacterized protein n=1 Tax=Narcine bancroftii TaxID=1343680 RepID=UPI0038314F38